MKEHQDHLTKIDAPLVEAWRIAAKDPDDQVGRWLLYGAPAGILHQPIDERIFPDAAAPSEISPEELVYDEMTFRNYAGVEEQPTTEEEMQAQIDKYHLKEFDTFKELTI